MSSNERLRVGEDSKLKAGDICDRAARDAAREAARIGSAKLLKAMLRMVA